MTFKQALISIALAALSPVGVPAQILDQIKKPIDYSKQADLSGKDVHLNDLQFQTISQPTREVTTVSPFAKGDLQLQRVDLNQVTLKSTEMSTVPEPVLPQANFTTKRADADKVNDRASQQLDQSRQSASITNRQIRPFVPGGEEDLKKQLNSIHP